MHPDDEEEGEDEIFIAGRSGAGGGALEADDSGIELRASDSRALDEVMELPPAAANVMYRTWDAVRAGVQEVQEGRPLTRGGTSSAGRSALTVESARKLLSSASGLALNSGSYGRPDTGSRSGLGSSHASRRPMTSAHGRPSGGRATVGTVTSILGSASPPACAGGGGFEGLPPITFPLTSGVRSMLRQMRRSSSSTPAEASPQGGNRHRSAWSGLKAPAAKEEERGEEGSIDLVRRMLAASRPDLLETLDSALEDDAVET